MSMLKIKQDGVVLDVRLNRPEVRNALNGEMIAELTSTFETVAGDDATRVVVLGGEGGFFCAGADLEWMRSFAQARPEENEEDARRFSKLLSTLNQFPKPIVAEVQGAAVGGGVGLVSVADIVLAADETVFSLAEVRLGLIPAVISPFVLAKIGESAARRYFLTGERFQAEEALGIGLVHEVVEIEDLKSKSLEVVRNLVAGGPHAIKGCKELIRKVGGIISEEIQDYTIKKISELPATPEAQEGMKAFLEKRRPSWQG